MDYDASHPLTQEFLVTVQKKEHYAIPGQTAAELIATRASSSQPIMGLATWDGACIRKADVGIASSVLRQGQMPTRPYQ